MPSNIKIKNLARSAGKTVDGSGNPTSAVSGSDMANIYLTGDINQGVYRHVPDTVGSISGASPRPIGDQYQFYEFDGVVPGIAFTSISTISDNANSNIGKQISFTFTTTGVTSTTYNVKLYGYDSNQQNETLLDTYSGYSTNVTNESKTFTGTLFPNQINFFKLLLTTTSGPTRYGEDITSIFIYPIDLTISSVVLSPIFTGAGTYNYTTGSVGFTVNVNGGVSPYYYNFNGAGYGSVGANTSTYNNSATTTDDAYDIVVKDSNSPTFDTATTRATTFRAPIRVAVSSLNAISEPYVNYTLGSTISNNVAGLTLTYAWVLDSATPSTSTSSGPTIYHTSLGTKTHRVNITQSSNSSIRHHNTASTTVQVSPTSNVIVSYAPGTETWTAAFDSVVNASLGTRTYEYQGRSKDVGGTYTDWGGSVTTASNSILAQSFAGKTNTAQYIQIRVRVRRTFTANSFDEVSSWTESNEALVPIKGIIVASDQTNILTGADRTFTGTVTLGGAADNSFGSPTISNLSGSFTGATISNGTSFTSTIAKNSGTTNVFTITVNNNCSRTDYGKIWHNLTCLDGNGYNLTKQITTQYKISSTSINLTLAWLSGNYWDNSFFSINSDLLYPNFTFTNFQYKTSLGGTYADLNGGFFGGYLISGFSAPASDQTWYVSVKGQGGVYTTSDLIEQSVTIWGYPGQNYGYSLININKNGSETNSGTPSTSSDMKLRVKRTSGNFNRISADFYYATNAYLDSLTDANITDSATSFTTPSTFNYYDGSTCAANTFLSKVELRYTIPSVGYYLHQLTQLYYLNNEQGSISVTEGSGFVQSGVAIRGTSFTFHVTYTTYGPPLTNQYQGDWYVYIGATAMNSRTGVFDEWYDDVNYFILSPYSYNQSTYCRYFFTAPSGITIAPRVRGNTYSTTIWGNEYQVTRNGNQFIGYTYDWTKNSTSEIGQSVVVLIYGKRLTSVTAPTITTTKGTSTVNITANGTGTGGDGTVDISLDGITRTNQWSDDNSTWNNFSGDSVSTGKAFGATIYVRQSWYHNDWGNTINSTASSVVLADLDWSLELSNNNNVSTSIRTSIGGAIIFSPGTLFALSTDSNVAAVTSVEPNTFFSTYFLTVSGLDTDPQMTGAYLGADGANLYRVYYYGNSYWIGNPASSYSDIKNTSSWRPTAAATGAIVVGFSAPGTYSTDKLITITGQKSSSDTKGQVKYYFKIRTRNEVNSIYLEGINYGCDSLTLRASVGQIDSADMLVIQKSTNNGSTWSDVYTNADIIPNQTYDTNQSGLSGTTLFRALLYAGATLKSTSNGVSHDKIIPIGNGDIPSNSLALNTNCSYLSYRVERNGLATSTTDSYYSVYWYWTDVYGTETGITTQTNRNFGVDYIGANGVPLSSVPCEVNVFARVTPYSAYGCPGTAFTKVGLIVKSLGINGNCDCTGTTCLVYGTMVEMGDGTFKKVEELQIGEVVRSLSINGLDTDIEDNWKGFYTYDFESEEGLSIITDIMDDGFSEYYIINNNLKVTHEHAIFIKRAEICMFVQVNSLVIGDYILKDDGEFEMITSIDIIDDYVRTISINIEDNDVYFADGVLVHNAISPKE